MIRHTGVRHVGETSGINGTRVYIGVPRLKDILKEFLTLPSHNEKTKKANKLRTTSSKGYGSLRPRTPLN